MRAPDLIRFARDDAAGNPLRTSLLILAMAIGIAAVIILTTLGNGARHYVVGEFSSLGTNLVIVLPGRSQTGGFNPANAITNTPRDLTIDDAKALLRASTVRCIALLAVGTSEISFGGKLREVFVAGTNAQFLEVRNLKLAQGRFLPESDWRRGASEAVIGAKIRSEVFGSQPALGQLIRVGDRRFRVIGVLEAKGQFLGVDLDDSAYIPVARAFEFFNRDGMMSIDLSYEESVPVAHIEREIFTLLKTRHGREDFTIVTQEDMLRTLSNILDVLTMAVGALGGISLLVGGVGIVTIAVTERTSEIGLLVALGAPRQAILGLFLGEAVVLSSVGGLASLTLGFVLVQLIHLLVPALPVQTPVSFVLTAEAAAVVISLLAGVLPARRAARLDPIETLRTE